MHDKDLTFRQNKWCCVRKLYESLQTFIIEMETTAADFQPDKTIIKFSNLCHKVSIL